MKCEEIPTGHSPDTLGEQLQGEPGLVLLHSACFEPEQGRYSLVAVRPFLTFRSFGSTCEWRADGRVWRQFGNPWQILQAAMARYELTKEPDAPFPLGGCFGYWGYDLKNFVEPRLPRRASRDLHLPDCYLGFYDSLAVFDHALGKVWVVSTGLEPDGSVSGTRACERMDSWKQALEGPETSTPERPEAGRSPGGLRPVRTTLPREAFIAAVEHAQHYIRAGDIYQVNLAQRLSWAWSLSGWALHQRHRSVAPAPFTAFLDCGGWQISSASPELFLRLSGTHIRTRPIKGTRPRGADADADARLAYELQTSPKEMAELIMITDLLRNDLGRVCAYGSVRVPELARLERFSHVQHLVSTVEGQLWPGLGHLEALAACFPGGSVTGAPKIRAMEIIDELEPVARGPYTGCLGYLGFNGESQFSIVIRTALCLPGRVHFHAGAGIVADSQPEAEYGETLAKARGWLEALTWEPESGPTFEPYNLAREETETDSPTGNW
jgi:para-aminobenzoate synthetase component 1